MRVYCGMIKGLNDDDLFALMAEWSNFPNGADDGRTLCELIFGALLSHGHNDWLLLKGYLENDSSAAKTRWWLECENWVFDPSTRFNLFFEKSRFYAVYGVRVIEAYDKAMAAGLYDKALLYNGKKVRHYAASNHKEYFAEGTESFFYRNDFYPFVAAELKEHDPVLYDLLVDIWGPLK